MKELEHTADDHFKVSLVVFVHRVERLFTDAVDVHVTPIIQHL